MKLTDIGSSLDPNDYFLLGGRLGFNKAKLNQFKHDNPRDIAGAMASMLIKWRKDQCGSHSDIREKLSDALRQVERADLAEAVYQNGEEIL